MESRIANEQEAPAPDRSSSGPATAETASPAPAAEDKSAEAVTYPPVENDFADSQLPKVFEVKNLALAPPAEPMRFSTSWAVYADSHPTPFGSPALSFDPVLIREVGDVEAFWRLWRWLTPPSVCTPPFTYHWFRKDVKPVWEHPRNKNGGLMEISVYDRDKTGLNNKAAMDDAFMTAVISCSGGSFMEAAAINGVALKIRQNKPVTMQIWTSTADVEKLRVLVKSVRASLGKVIGTKTLQKIDFFSHFQLQNARNARRGKAVKAQPEFTL